MIRFTNALNRRRATLGNRDKGFTLIELLVVVIIIGVLAAIAIPVYIGVQNNAKDSSAQSDLTNAKIAVVAYYAAKNAMPPTITTSVLADYGYTSSGTNVVVDASLATATPTAFCLRTTSGSGSKWYATPSTAPVTATTAPSGCKAS